MPEKVILDIRLYAMHYSGKTYDQYIKYSVSYLKLMEKMIKGAVCENYIQNNMWVTFLERVSIELFTHTITVWKLKFQRLYHSTDH